MLLMVSHFALWVLHKRFRRQLVIVTITTILYSIFWMLFMEYELTAVLGQETYGSDAAYYWELTKSIIDGMIPEQVIAAPYIWYCVWVLRTSFFPSFVWVILANIVLYSLTLNLLFVVVSSRLEGLARRRFLAMFAVYCCNGIIIWTILRGLKETLFIFFLMSIFYIFHLFVSVKGRLLKAILLGTAIIVGYALQSLRVGSEYMVLLVFAGAIPAKWFRCQFAALQEKSHRLFSCDLAFKLALFGIVLTGVIYLMWPNIVARIQYVQNYEQLSRSVFAESFEKNLGNPGLFEYGLAFARFILGPGPIRALHQIAHGGVFVVSISSGDILILLGSTQWWLTLAFGIVYWVKRWKDSSLFWLMTDFVLVLLLQIGAYTFVYAGSGDTRHRAVMYILAMPLFICLYVRANSKPVLSWVRYQGACGPSGQHPAI